jgi:hypothetical protein
VRFLRELMKRPSTVVAKAPHDCAEAFRGWIYRLSWWHDVPPLRDHVLGERIHHSMESIHHSMAYKIVLGELIHHSMESTFHSMESTFHSMANKIVLGGPIRAFVYLFIRARRQ